VGTVAAAASLEAYGVGGGVNISPPANLSATYDADGSVTVTWDTYETAEKYVIKYKCTGAERVSDKINAPASSYKFDAGGADKCKIHLRAVTEDGRSDNATVVAHRPADEPNTPKESRGTVDVDEETGEQHRPAAAAADDPNAPKEREPRSSADAPSAPKHVKVGVSPGDFAWMEWYMPDADVGLGDVTYGVEYSCIPNPEIQCPIRTWCDDKSLKHIPCTAAYPPYCKNLQNDFTITESRRDQLSKWGLPGGVVNSVHPNLYTMALGVIGGNMCAVDITGFANSAEGPTVTRYIDPTTGPKSAPDPVTDLGRTEIHQSYRNSEYFLELVVDWSPVNSTGSAPLHKYIVEYDCTTQGNDVGGKLDVWPSDVGGPGKLFVIETSPDRFSCGPATVSAVNMAGMESTPADIRIHI
jgi:hypothetical protein